MTQTRILAVLVTLALHALTAIPGSAAGKEPQPMNAWQIGRSIVTYFAGPPVTDAIADQMADLGLNLVWCGWNEQRTLDELVGELDRIAGHGLRIQLFHELLTPAALDDPATRSRLDALINRVKTHPALYSYHIIDEPCATTFPGLGKLVAYLRERDPAHLAYINLFPIYANNEQLGTAGDAVTAYREHLRQYLDIVKPALLSYDHYHFSTGGADGGQYFLNLALVRQAARDAGILFINITQACSWSPGVRVPNAEERRFLVYTTLAYGARGISYYVYGYPGHTGAIADPDGTPTEHYYSLKPLNHEFLAIASELQPLKSLGVYHLGMVPEGGVPLPAGSAFRVDPPVAPMAYEPPEKMKGLLMGTFGPAGASGPQDEPTAVVVVNLDYTQKVTTTVVGPGPLEVLDARTGKWRPSASGPRARILLHPGDGKLVRLRR
jgi:hypothetical protein